MSRPKKFDGDSALNRAMTLFWDKGFAATSTSELIEAMQIGRQSMYHTFGDKRTLYIKALTQYHAQITAKRIAALQSGLTSLAGIEAMLLSVADENSEVRLKGCMSVGSIIEFGNSQPDIVKVRKMSRFELERGLTEAVECAKDEGDISQNVDTSGIVNYIFTILQGLQIDARAGIEPEALRATAHFSLAAITNRH